MPAALIESYFLPPLEYFCALLGADCIIVERHEYFVKQTYRNRCYINTANGLAMLSVPVVDRHGKKIIADIRIEGGLRWRNNHWRTLQSAYANAPFFEHYADELRTILFGRFGFLIDLNTALLSFCLGNAGMVANVSATVAYEETVAKEVFDLRSTIMPRKDGSASVFYRDSPYHQVFGNAFAGNLSLLDLLFCEGPASLSVLHASRKKI
jgi:hypothetical protein